MNKNMIIGGVAGGIIGVTTALLLAPKSGNKLLQDLYKPLEPALRHAFSQGKKEGQKHVKHPSKGGSSHAQASKGGVKTKKHAAVAKKSSSKRSPAKKGGAAEVEKAGEAAS